MGYGDISPTEIKAIIWFEVYNTLLIINQFLFTAFLNVLDALLYKISRRVSFMLLH